MVDRGIVNYSDVLKMNSKDIDTENDNRESIIRAAIDRAAKIKKDTGESIPWQMFAGYNVGLTQQAVESGKEDEEEDPEEDPEEPEENSMFSVGDSIYRMEDGELIKCQ